MEKEKNNEENQCGYCGKVFYSDEVWDFCSKECADKYEEGNPLRVINDYDVLK